MLKTTTIQTMYQHFERIFVIPIRRSTYREVQNIVFAATEGKEELFLKVLRSILQGSVEENFCTEKSKDLFQKLIDKFSIPIRASKEIFERGDVVSTIGSDLLEGKQSIGFLTRIKRIDGEEFHFITDPEITLHFFQHFFARIQELAGKSEAGELFSQSYPSLHKLEGELHKLLEEFSPKENEGE